MGHPIMQLMMMNLVKKISTGISHMNKPMLVMMSSDLY